MLKRNYRKLVSVVSAAAMLATLAAPLAMAEDADTSAVSAEEIATLAAGSVIVENDFDALAAGDLISLTTEKQDAYSDIEGLNIHIGNVRKDTDVDGTKAAIVSGVGIDGSNALVVTYGDKMVSPLYAPRLEFMVPEVEDNYMISLKMYPTENQAGTMTDGATVTSPSTDLGVVANEWNNIEIYVTRSGRIVNVNDVTVIDDEVTSAPVLWGKVATAGLAGSGDYYIDDFAITSITALPTPIPTPTPVPAARPQVGDVYDFENYTEESLVHMQANPPVPYTDIVGFELYVGSRTDPRYNTKAAIASVGGSKVLQLNYAENADAGRGPRAQLLAPETDDYYKVTFSAMVDDAQDLVVGTSTSSHSGVEANLTPGVWNTVEIFMYAGQRIVLANSKFVEMAVTDDLPVIWGLNVASAGALNIDNYAISEVTAQEITDALAATLSITNAENTVYTNDDGTYNFIESFDVPEETCGVKATWAVFESTDEGATWVETADIRAGKKAITVTGAVSDEKLYKLVGTVLNNDLIGSKEFVLNYVKSENVVDVVIADLDITSDLYSKEVEKKTVENEDGTTSDVYIIRGNFAVPESEWVTAIDWKSSDSSLIKVGPKGSILLYPKEATTVTLTATVSYNGESQTKDFTLDLTNQYTTIYRLVDAELNNVTLAPNGTNGNKVTTVTLDSDKTTKVTYDLALSTTSSTKGMEIKWSSSDADILSSAGVINVDNMKSNEVTLTKKVTYSINDVEIYSGEKDYEINVEFDPETVKAEAVALATAYALANDEKATESTIEDSTLYNVAMEMLYDRYVTRFDANYDDNFEDIPDEVDNDFDLPTEGAFGSKITWTSSLTNIKINDKGEADVTRASSDKKGKLTATFTSGASVNAEAKVIDVTVEGKGGSGSSGGGGGGGSLSNSYGGGNTYIGSLGAAAATPAPTVSKPATDTTIKGEFTDLGEASWAEVAINYLASKGIVSGRTSTTFAPNDNITRAEFAKILVGAFELPIVAASAGFADVADDAWYAAYVNTCFAAGIITGYDSTTFGPNDLVTRQDMAVMVMRAANLKGIAVAPINEKIDFADADEIGAYAVDAVTTLQMGGIINGMTADTFAPTANATRAQAAKILYSFCN